jgi:hypothetical protein
MTITRNATILGMLRFEPRGVIRSPKNGVAWAIQLRCRRGGALTSL